ncbi:DUF6458 family protein [Microbacterium sp. E-13]|uniref:DUF6458 family protein n=1 Tax=Microbacterium sp. E-13 TaxID=3404048 RepID=UPI003CEE3378
MSIGAGIVLFAIGAILVWAVNVDLGWLNLDMVGYILMVAGAVVFIMGLILMFRRRRTDTITRTDIDGTHRVTRAPDDTAGL